MDEKGMPDSNKGQQIDSKIGQADTSTYHNYIHQKLEIHNQHEAREIRSENTYLNTNFYQNYLPMEPNAVVYPTVSMNYLPSGHVEPLQLPPIVTSNPGHIPEHMKQYYHPNNVGPPVYSPISSDFPHEMNQVWMTQSHEGYSNNYPQENMGWIMSPMNLNTNFNSVQRVPPRRMSISLPHHFPVLPNQTNQRYSEVNNSGFGSRPDLSPFKPTPGRPSQNNIARRRVNSVQSSLSKELNLPITTIRERSVSLSEKKDPSLYFKQFPCTHPGCIKVFKRSEHLKRHLTTVHTDIKPYVCPFPDCEKKFSRSDNLNQHIKTHKNRKMSANF